LEDTLNSKATLAIKHALENAGWTQARLARSMNVTRATVCDVVHGRTHSGRIMRRVAQIMRRPVRAVFPHYTTPADRARQERLI
jgi:transcriptional regulator with XRE-family HTH domain